MDPWQKESLGLEVGDIIIWQDEAIEIEGQPALVEPGMRGEVISLHDGFHLDVAEVEPIPLRAMVQFENGFSLMVDERMRWERVASSHQSSVNNYILQDLTPFPPFSDFQGGLNCILRKY